jgi:hypothetical protein
MKKMSKFELTQEQRECLFREQDWPENSPPELYWEDEGLIPDQKCCWSYTIFKDGKTGKFYKLHEDSTYAVEVYPKQVTEWFEVE